jgi:CelD/BcsL family acetyltransferase involved in cellulose biosynthesis
LGDTVAFIGAGSDVTPEYLDVIVQRGWELPVVRIMVRRLLDDSRISEIDLQPIAAHSPTLAQLADLLAAGSGLLRHRPGSSCPFLTLPRSAEQFRISRSRNYRKKVGEFERRCDHAFSARLRVSTTVAEVTRDLKTLKTLHVSRWNGASRAFQSTQYVAFHDAFAQLALERGWLRLYSLESGQDTMAILYCYFYGQRFYFYQSGRDPKYAKERVGLVLMHKVILEAIREEATVFDFLSGDEPYKSRWATGKTCGSRVVYWKSVTAWAVSVCRQRLSTFVSIPDRLLAGRRHQP